MVKLKALDTGQPSKVEIGNLKATLNEALVTYLP